MSDDPLNLVIGKFREDAERVDVFMNGDEVSEYMTSEGVAVPSARKFIQQAVEEIAEEYGEQVAADATTAAIAGSAANANIATVKAGEAAASALLAASITTPLSVLDNPQPKGLVSHLDFSTAVTDTIGRVNRWVAHGSGNALIAPSMRARPNFVGCVKGDSTATLRLVTDSAPTLKRVNTYKLPDSAHAFLNRRGFGWTITGLAEMNFGEDATLMLAANDGRINGLADTNYQPSLLVTTFPPDLKIVRELLLKAAFAALGVDMRSTQGCFQRVTTGDLYFSDVHNKRIRCVARTGTAATGYDAVLHPVQNAVPIPANDIVPPNNITPNGLAYDPVTDTLFVGDDSGVIYNIDFSGNVIEGFTIAGLTGFDHLCFEPSTRILYFSAGANGANGAVYGFDTLSRSYACRYLNLDQCQAIEGIIVRGTKLWVANDPLFHSESLARPQINNIVEFDRPAIGGKSGEVLFGYGAFRRPALNASMFTSRFLGGYGDPTTGSPAFGWVLVVGDNVDTLIFTARTSGQAAAYTVTWNISSLAQVCCWTLVATPGVGVELKINGTVVTPASTGGSISNWTTKANVHDLAAFATNRYGVAPTRFFRDEIFVLGVANDATDRVNIETWLAVRMGVQTQFPVGHPGRTATTSTTISWTA